MPAAKTETGVDLRMVECRGFARFTFLALLGMGAFSFTSAQAVPVAVDLPPQPLASALREFARQTGIQVAIPAELTDGKTSVAVKGKFEAADVLNKLLQGSGLIAYPVNDNTYGIRRPEASTPRVVPNDPSADRTDGQAPQGSSGLQEIIVTANKREERVLDVPVSVTALSGTLLADTQAVRMEDYQGRIPGLRVTNLNFENSGTSLSIRGIGVVGVYIDDTAYGSTTALGSGFIPDLDPLDLERVEVLKGPQGTLYGAGAMGGLF